MKQYDMGFTEEDIKELRKQYQKGKIKSSYLRKFKEVCLDDYITGREYPYAGGPVDLNVVRAKTRKLELSERNEALVKKYLFQKWTELWIERRQQHINQLMDIALSERDEDETDYTEETWEKIKKSRFLKHDRPTDLSGACKLVAQFCFLVFPLHGTVVSNPLHTFILMSDEGWIYDLNKNCNDVQSMHDKHKNAYEFDIDYNAKKSTLNGLKSWHDRLLTNWVPNFYKMLKTIEVEYHNPDKPYHQTFFDCNYDLHCVANKQRPKPK